MEIQLEDVSLSFGSKSLFRGVSLTIPARSFVVLTGASGSGKSSLLRLLNRLGEPSSGRVLVDGTPIAELDAPRLRRRIALVPQSPTMLDGSVRHNLLFPFHYKSAGKNAVPGDEALAGKLSQLVLDGVLLSDTARDLSVGQRQRLALLRVLLTKPEVLLVDEPTSALDARSREIVEREIVSLNQNEGVTVVMVTHQEASFDGAAVQRWRLEDGAIRRESA